VQRWLTAKHDNRKVVVDTTARYFGAELNDRSLTPGDKARLGKIRFDEWLKRAAA
jgi:hypothetical protein